MGTPRREGRRARLAGQPRGARRVRRARRGELSDQGVSPLSLARRVGMSRCDDRLAPPATRQLSTTARRWPRARPHARRRLGAVRARRRQRPLPLPRCPAWPTPTTPGRSSRAVNAAFIGAGFLAGTLATGLVLWKATRWRSFSLLPPALWVLATHAAGWRRSSTRTASSGTTRRPGCGRSSTRFVPLGDPGPGHGASARVRRAAPPADPRLRRCASCRACSASGCWPARSRCIVAPVELGEHWLWALTPLLGPRRRRLVRAVRDDAADASRSACGGRSRG